MKELLELILHNITTHPDDVVIDETEEDGRKVFTITVNPEDMGRVIGKSGKVIRAIRSLAHVVAIRQGERYRINVAEVDGQPADDAPTTQDTSTPATGDTPPSTPAADTANAADNQTDEAAEDKDEDLIVGAIDVADDQNQDQADSKPAK